ncbi:MFS transporter [Micromonospora rosaria]|uniref:MFS transporter n=1 Tax=Micromonospora rosaria TaxID=47874 RepID=UPI0012F915A0|nr:MFS transporter [Micromonospora rosaria]
MITTQGRGQRRRAPIRHALEQRLSRTRTAKIGTAFAVFAASVSFLISLAGSSLKSTVQVFFLGIADSFEVSRGSLAIATTLFAVVTAVTSSVIGHLADRIGAIPVLAVGTALNGVVLLLAATAGDLWLFVLTYGVVGAVAVTMLSFVPLGVLADQLFQGRNSGLLYALLTNGAAVGFMVLVPLWVHLDRTMTWNQVLFALGLVFLVVLLPLSLILVRLSVRRRPVAPVARVSLWAATVTTFRHPQIRALVLAFVGCGSTMAFIDVHLFSHLHDHGDERRGPGRGARGGHRRHPRAGAAPQRGARGGPLPRRSAVPAGDRRPGRRRRARRDRPADRRP